LTLTGFHVAFVPQDFGEILTLQSQLDVAQTHLEQARRLSEDQKNELLDAKNENAALYEVSFSYSFLLEVIPLSRLTKFSFFLPSFLPSRPSTKNSNRCTPT